jgi:hypothetical protein
VQFNAARDLAAAKKLAFGGPNSGGTGKTAIHWSINDQVTIWSATAQEADYKATTGGTNTSPLEHVSETALTWNHPTAAQDFYAFYPAHLEDVEDPSFAAGILTFTIPEEQDGTMKNVYMAGKSLAQTANGAGEAEDDESDASVNLDFESITTVIELNITSAHALTAIRVSTGSDMNLANTFTYNFGTAAITPTGVDAAPSVTATKAVPAATPTTVYLSIAPADLPYLRFTFTSEGDVSAAKMYNPTGGDDITSGNLYRFNVTLTAEDFSDRVYLGIGVGGGTNVDAGTIVANPLYFAKGNLIAEYDNIPLPTDNITPDRFHIANQAGGEYLANDNQTNDISSFLNKERDLFKVGVVNSANYWVNNNTNPTAPPVSVGQDFIETSADLVRYAVTTGDFANKIDDTYRSANRAEWTAVYDNCTSYWYDGSTNGTATRAGTSGGNATAPSSIDISSYPEYDNAISGLFILGIGSASGKHIFLPATGRRNSTPVDKRGTAGYYWSGTRHDTPFPATIASDFYFIDGQWYISMEYWYVNMALRPVSASPSE